MEPGVAELSPRDWRAQALSRRRCFAGGAYPSSRRFARRRTRQRSQPEWAEPRAFRASGARSRGTFCRAIERGPTEGREPPKSFAAIFAGIRLTDDDQCRAQGSLRGRTGRLRMGFVEKMPHMSHARCVRGPPRSLRGQSARRPGRDAFRSRGSSSTTRQPARSCSTRTRCRRARWRAGSRRACAPRRWRRASSRCAWQGAMPIAAAGRIGAASS